ncbi:hypothetical protein P152DRAFT_458675 [Eremomyces bilateralis CBS 781.70]|uniref:Large ribosomal subunit protein bL27m n=1 Tax=Eremomyces bilateralis CBS 781.70 TaxID=1392243 RepID=A0A6G1G3A2_9PEZI|nr:uncharacterized protein P152DRAFT_458675 [Eremomyces bilateralis CBS 781.70]KAF1812289.1 hypothetical protein P152DRAFT_458675 [Eremomyces bilateralis CBS 781.70]
MWSKSLFSAPLRSIAGESLLRFQPCLRLLPISQVRNAAHAAEGRANGAKKGAGKRLGLKKGAEELVVPGVIIFRQRGSKWHPGENCAMGRDHTIYATEKGYVKYYRDPNRNPKKKYIGVVFERHWRLPVPVGEPRRRRLGMLAVPRESEGQVGSLSPLTPAGLDGEAAGLPGVAVAATSPEESSMGEGELAKRRRRKDYVVRESNWEIGRTAEKAGVTATKFVRKDRFRAWRRAAARHRRISETKSVGRKAKKGKQGKVKK